MCESTIPLMASVQIYCMACSFKYKCSLIKCEKLGNTVASEAYQDWSGEAAGARLRVNFALKLLLSQNFCNQHLMRFMSFASNIGPTAAVPAGLAPAPLKYSNGKWTHLSGPNILLAM